MGKQQRRKRRRNVAVELRNEGFRGISRFLLEFSQLQFTIRVVLSKRLDLDEKYFDIVTVFTSLTIGVFLDRFGPPGVFGFIAANMAVVCISIGVFGPRTRDLALEEIV